MKEILAEIERLAGLCGRPVKLMEVCGTHTVAIFRHGVRGVIPQSIKLLSGPGCPVCVTSVKDIDRAIAIARMPRVIFTTFGDMMRVPGGVQSLDDVRGEGCDIRIVYSPLEAVRLAGEHPDKEVVFFAAGFETTAPVIAGTLAEAERLGRSNFSIFPVHKLVPPALKALLDSEDVQVDGFILPGHVSTIIGSQPYGFVAADYHKPSVITGFSAEDILTGIMMILKQMEEKRLAVEIQYTKVVRPEGNPRAVEMVYQYFEPCDAYWRGIGEIPGSGLALRKEYRRLDAMERFSPDVPDHPEPSGCSCGDVLRGVKVPFDCPLFGTACTPESPVGACMVSTEGSCSAYYKYGAFHG